MNRQEPTTGWHRIAPGEDPGIDRFLAATVRHLNHHLQAANGWHRSGRRYAFYPPLPDPRSDEVFALGAIALRRAPEKRAPWVAIIIFSIPNLMLAAFSLLDLTK